MKSTLYFREQILRKRPYLKKRWCAMALKKAIRKEIQPDGRIRHWIFVRELSKYLRVVTLADGKTIHNAFPDRDFQENGL